MNIRSVWRSLSGRLVTRVVAGFLIVTVPLTIVITVVLTSKASDSVTAATNRGIAAVARTLAGQMDDFVFERTGDLTVVAGHLSGDLNDPDIIDVVTRIQDYYKYWDVLEITDLTGKVVAGAPANATFDPSRDEWFRSAASGQTVVTSPQDIDGDIRWILAVPVLDTAGHPIGVVTGELALSNLPRILDPEVVGASGAAVVVDKDHHLVFSDKLGNLKTADESDLLAKGLLRTVVDDQAVDKALAGQSGTARFDYAGQEVVGGYAAVKPLNWAVLVNQPASTVEAPVNSGRNLAFALAIGGILLATALSIVFARRTAVPVVALASGARKVAKGDLTTRVEPSGPRELRELMEAFNAMVDSLSALVKQVQSASTEVDTAAAQLSASSEELAATTTQQSSAVTEVSATTEELARASSSIADTVDEVAAQSTETRDNLEQAEADIALSSERTLALTARVGEINAILSLINDIADQTNLLALNAAIEAARAGEDGRGFAVVAEEVRQLAERSKSSAAEIAVIVDGIHSETNATVMAMEKGATQMQRGLRLQESVTNATSQVRMTTQQQRSATGQVVETMEQLTQASRQVSDTAQEIAASAALLATLASNLKETADDTTNGQVK